MDALLTPKAAMARQVRLRLQIDARRVCVGPFVLEKHETHEILGDPHCFSHTHRHASGIIGRVGEISFDHFGLARLDRDGPFTS